MSQSGPSRAIVSRRPWASAREERPLVPITTNNGESAHEHDYGYPIDRRNLRRRHRRDHRFREYVTRAVV